MQNVTPGPSYNPADAEKSQQYAYSFGGGQAERVPFVKSATDEAAIGPADYDKEKSLMKMEKHTFQPFIPTAKRFVNPSEGQTESPGPKYYPTFDKYGHVYVSFGPKPMSRSSSTGRLMAKPPRPEHKDTVSEMKPPMSVDDLEKKASRRPPLPQSTTFSARLPEKQYQGNRFTHKGVDSPGPIYVPSSWTYKKQATLVYGPVRRWVP